MQQITPAQRRRFERLIWPWTATVLRFAKFLTKDEHSAEDLAQETMMRAVRSIDSFEEGTDAKAWLLTIERRLFLDRVRVHKNQRLPSLNTEGALEPAAPAEDVLAGVCDKQWEDPEDLLARFSDEELIDGLKTLPDDVRWTLLLVDVEGLEQADAAGILGVPVGTVKSRAHRGRRMLRDRLYHWALARGWVAAADKESA